MQAMDVSMSVSGCFPHTVAVCWLDSFLTTGLKVKLVVATILSEFDCEFRNYHMTSILGISRVLAGH